MYNIAKKSLQGSVQISVLQTNFQPVYEEILTSGFSYSEQVISALLASPWLCRCGRFCFGYQSWGASPPGVCALCHQCVASED